MKSHHVIACAAVHCLVLSMAMADDFTWNSDRTDLTWNFVGGNWTLGGAPTLLIPDVDDNVFFDMDLLGSGLTLESNPLN